jgi:membrane protease YdiL (CAAX protease family)
MDALPTLQPASAHERLGPANAVDAWRWLAVAAAGIVVGAALSLILAAVGAWLVGTPGGARTLATMAEPPVWFVVTELVGLWTGFAAASFVVTRSGRTVGLRFERHDAWYLFLGVVLQLAVDVAYVNAKGLSKPEHTLLGGGTGWLLVVPALMTVLLAPLFEELYFRGVLLRGLLVAWRTPVAAVGVVLSVVVDATLFGLAHLGTDAWIQLPGLVALGAILCVLAIRSGRLGPSIMTHAGFNLLAVSVFAYQR